MDINIENRLLNYTVLVLVSIGIVFVYSSSSVYAYKQFGSSEYFLYKHLLYVGIGIILMSILSQMDYVILKRHPYLIISVCILLVLLVYFPKIGVMKNGAKRWLNLGFVTFQPSELLKYGFVIYLSYLISKSQERISSFKSGFLPGLFVMLIIAIILLKQPDFGTTVLLFFTFLSLYFVAGTRLSYILGFIIAAIPIVYFIITRSAYKKARIFAFLNPELYKNTIGYQVYESLISLGSGGLFGQGLGMSKQKMLYLPAAHTDFILAIIGEETGFVGVTILILLFLIFIFTGFRIALKARDLFGVYLGFAITIMFAYQVLINAAVVMSLLPTKGLTLPFISYGGSSVVFSLAGVGILNSIHANSNIASEDSDSLKSEVGLIIDKMMKKGKI
ncbi:MAG: putative lipid II flippase FtsW [Deltaproteobacteria bacterium]|nr:putative lipid II flippase FtsW [Deltaproteobacteria bacterium]